MLSPFSGLASSPKKLAALLSGRRKKKPNLKPILKTTIKETEWKEEEEEEEEVFPSFKRMQNLRFVTFSDVVTLTSFDPSR